MYTSVYARAYYCWCRRRHHHHRPPSTLSSARRLLCGKYLTLWPDCMGRRERNERKKDRLEYTPYLLNQIQVEHGQVVIGPLSLLPACSVSLISLCLSPQTSVNFNVNSHIFIGFAVQAFFVTYVCCACKKTMLKRTQLEFRLLWLLSFSHFCLFVDFFLSCSSPIFLHFFVNDGTVNTNTLPRIRRNVPN